MPEQTTLANRWQSYEARVCSRSSTEARKGMRWAFYAGALSVLWILGRRRSDPNGALDDIKREINRMYSEELAP